MLIFSKLARAHFVTFWQRPCHSVSISDILANWNISKLHFVRRSKSIS